MHESQGLGPRRTPRIRVLGPTAASLEDTPVALGGPLQRSVLILLLTGRGRALSVDRIIDALWDGRPPQHATTSLQSYVSNLRRALEPERPARSPARILVTAPPGYALRLPTESVDAWHFEAQLQRSRTLAPAPALALLDEALGWFSGPPLAEVADQAWAQAEVARLTELRLLARESAIALMVRAGRCAEAVPRAEELTRDQPLREEGWRLLALAHWACERPADALTVLRRARARLAAEVGLDPGHALVELEQAIVDGRVGELGADVPRVASASGQQRADRSGEDADCGRFVGRAAQLAAAFRLAETARRQGGVMLVTGEAGEGKSAFLAQVTKGLRSSGWTVAAGQCPESEGAPAAWAWTEVLRCLEERRAPTEPSAPPALSARDARSTQDRLRASAGSGPLAIVLDDLHRADTETLALVQCAAELIGAPVLLIVAFRASEADERLTGTLAALAHRAPLRLPLPGLSLPEVGAVVRGIRREGVDAQTIAALYERTGGNPFFVHECAILPQSEGAGSPATAVPEGVRDVLRRRLNRLPDGAMAALRLVAVFGCEADIDLVLAAAEAPEHDVLDGIEAAVIAGLLTEPTAGRVRFRQPIVRDAVYTDMVRLRRAHLQTRAERAMRPAKATVTVPRPSHAPGLAIRR